MANWNECINIAGLFRLYNTGSIGLQQLAKAIVRKLKLTQAYATADVELIDIMMAFGEIDEVARLKDFIVVLDMLYEFGDKDLRLLIEAENVSPHESDDIPAKTKNPFEDDTRPQFGANQPHFHGPGNVYRGPDLVQSGEYPAPDEPQAKAEWDRNRAYKAGDRVVKAGLEYECLIGNSNADPATNSYNRYGEPWKWLGPADKNSSEPKPVLKDRLTCAIPSTARVYPATRKYHHMSEEEFNKKLEAANIIPATMPRELYSYMKDCEEDYQEWLISRWHKQNLTFREPAASVQYN